ncbi:hypothetical protein Barb6XT_02730 [Bacteroidales bacterium Barb6XT]|nr:hypothetical protein Barb6XT_02730 [Bacteroidales bacterium Barb6XT]
MQAAASYSGIPDPRKVTGHIFSHKGKDIRTLLVEYFGTVAMVSHCPAC